MSDRTCRICGGPVSGQKYEQERYCNDCIEDFQNIEELGGGR